MSFSRASQNTGPIVLHVVPLEDAREEDLSCDEGSDLDVTDPIVDDDDEVTSKKSLLAPQKRNRADEDEIRNVATYISRTNLPDNTRIPSPARKVFHSVETLHEARKVVKQISSSVLVNEAATIRRRIYALERGTSKKPRLSNSNGVPVSGKVANAQTSTSPDDEAAKSVKNFPTVSDQERATILQQAFRLKRMSSLLQQIDAVYYDLIDELVHNPHHEITYNKVVDPRLSTTQYKR